MREKIKPWTVYCKPILSTYLKNNSPFPIRSSWRRLWKSPCAFLLTGKNISFTQYFLLSPLQRLQRRRITNNKSRIFFWLISASLKFTTRAARVHLHKSIAFMIISLMWTRLNIDKNKIQLLCYVVVMSCNLDFEIEGHCSNRNKKIQRFSINIFIVGVLYFTSNKSKYILKSTKPLTHWPIGRLRVHCYFKFFPHFHVFSLV